MKTNAFKYKEDVYQGQHYIPFVIMSLTMIPVPSRLAACLVILLELNLLVLAGTLLRPLGIWKMLSEYKTILILSALITIVIIYSRLIALWSPAMQMQLGFVMYLQAVSSFVISTIFGNEDSTLTSDKMPVPDRKGAAPAPLPASDRWLRQKEAAVFSIAALVVFALRDIIGYGTITYPMPSGVGSSVILKGECVFPLAASVPGALLCTAGMIGAFIMAEKTFDIFTRASDAHKNEEDSAEDDAILASGIKDARSKK